jgi:hypothetical protein
MANERKPPKPPHPAALFPANDVLLHEVLRVLVEHPEGLSIEDVEREIAARTKHEHLLAGPRKGRKVLSAATTFCLEILGREALALHDTDRWRVTAAGVAADDERLDRAWKNEIPRLEPWEIRFDKVLDNFFDDL